MDKRWRNLILLFVLILVLVAAGIFLSSQPVVNDKATLMKKADVALNLLASEDVNYADIAIAVEAFNYSLDLGTIESLKKKSSSSPELLALLAIEERQNNVAAEYTAITNKEYPYFCADINKTDIILSDAFSIVDDLDAQLKKSNPLRIDSNVLYYSYREMENDISNLTEICVNTADQGELS